VNLYAVIPLGLVGVLLAAVAGGLWNRYQDKRRSEQWQTRRLVNRG